MLAYCLMLNEKSHATQTVSSMRSHAKSDPAFRASHLLVQRITDVIKPENVLLVNHQYCEDSDSFRSFIETEHSLIDAGVKVSRFSGETPADRERLDLALFFVVEGATSQLRQDVEMVAKHAKEVLLLTPCLVQDQLCASELIKATGVAAAVLAKNKMFQTEPFEVGILGVSTSLFQHLPESDSNRIFAEISRFQMQNLELQSERDLARLSVSDVGDDDTKLVAESNKDVELDKLRLKLDEALQNMYIARDAAVGADAEKARLSGQVAELEYKIFVRDQEIATLTGEIGHYEGIVFGKKPETGYTFSQRVRKFKIVRLVAKLTRPIRKALR